MTSRWSVLVILPVLVIRARHHHDSLSSHADGGGCRLAAHAPALPRGRRAGAGSARGYRALVSAARNHRRTPQTSHCETLGTQKSPNRAFKRSPPATLSKPLRRLVLEQDPARLIVDVFELVPCLQFGDAQRRRPQVDFIDESNRVLKFGRGFVAQHVRYRPGPAPYGHIHDCVSASKHVPMPP